MYIVYISMNKLVIFIATLGPLIASANEQHVFNEGDNWVLEARSNRLSSDSKVLYHIPSDASLGMWYKTLLSDDNLLLLASKTQLSPSLNTCCSLADAISGPRVAMKITNLFILI